MSKTIHIHLPMLSKKPAKGKDSQQFPTHYKTAEVKSSGKFYRVLASNKPTKEETDKDGSLLLDVDGSKHWEPIKNLHATL